MKVKLPILYSFRRCPYAIRARLALRISRTQVELREVVLADKPEVMLAVSPKATVPVLVLPDGTVIDESMDIMLWVLRQNDPENWLGTDEKTINSAQELIDLNDNAFKQHLDHYKYADRFPEQSQQHYRQQCEGFLQLLEDKLSQHPYLLSDRLSWADMAIFPFIRQFAFVDKQWFDHAKYTKLKLWLDDILGTDLFNQVMKKYPQWKAGSDVIIF